MNWQAARWLNGNTELGIREIDGKGEAVRLYRQLGGSGELPGFLYGDLRYQGIVVELLAQGRTAGIAHGVVQSKDRCFYMHFFKVKNEYGKKSSVIYFLSEVFRLVRHSYGAEKAILFAEQQTLDDHVLLDLIKQIPCCEISRTEYLREFGMKTKDFCQLRKHRWYCPDLLEKKQCKAIPWKDFDENRKKMLQEAELSNHVSKDYVSPGSWEENWKYDEATSFALIKECDNELLGWIVTERLSEEIVKLRRFYIYKEARKLRLGPAFSTWVLDRISEIYQELWFEVVPGNRQMEMFAFCYCKPILAFNYIKCNIKINFKEDETWNGHRKNSMSFI